MKDIVLGGGVVADISGVSKTAKYQPIIKQIRRYIDSMNFDNKPVTYIALNASDYDSLLKAAKDNAKKQGLPDIIGLRFGQIPVKRA